MTNNGMDREKVNLSDASREKKCRELAVLDWSKTPSSRIKEVMGDPSWQTIAHYRDSAEYKDTLAILREEFRESIAKLPDTRELRQKISLGMTLSLERLIEILSGGHAAKDAIGAARLMAQLDGRFLKGDGEDDGQTTRNVDSVASELLGALKRQQERVN
jgi:hypothetical protein